MVTKSDQYKPLRPQHSSTSYGVYGQPPRPPGIQPPRPSDSQPPPPYGATPTYRSDRYQPPHVRRHQQDSSRLRSTSATTWCGAFVFLIIVVQFVAFIFFYDLPTKLDVYGKATARMHEQRDAMRSERIALRGESDRLEKERLKWEKAREDRVPQGAFWETPPQPAPDCLSYGKREYSGALQNIPEDWTDLDACMNMPAKIKDVSVRRPDRCGYVANSPHIRGFWTVDWDQPDCKPWHQDFTDKVSLGQQTRSYPRIRLGSPTLIPRVARTWDLAPVSSRPGL